MYPRNAGDQDQTPVEYRKNSIDTAQRPQGTAWNVEKLQAGLGGFGGYFASVSSQIVTGPSLTSATFMSAPKRPVATGTPRSDSARAKAG